MIRWITAVLASMSLLSLGACSTASDPVALDQVWSAAYVYMPDEPYPMRMRDGPDAIGAKLNGKPPLPTVIYLHGCEGFDNRYNEAVYPRRLAQAGFLVIVPDSFARPGRKKACGNVMMNTVDLRRAEVRDALRRLPALPWVDQRNLFLAGHSEGGITTAMFDGGNAFNAYFISGWTCTSPNAQFDRIHAPADKPVLAALGSADPYYVGTYNAGSCGSRLAGRPDSRSIVIPGAGHDVEFSPGVVPSLVEFFKAHVVTADAT